MSNDNEIKDKLASLGGSLDDLIKDVQNNQQFRLWVSFSAQNLISLINQNQVDCNCNYGTVDYHCIGVDLHPSLSMQQVFAVLFTGLNAYYY